MILNLADLNETQLQAHDFWDFGADGTSMEFCVKHLGGSNGVGFNLEDWRLKDVSDRGFAAVQGNIFDIPCTPGCVDFVSMSHFVEHLHGADQLEAALRLALTAARDFVHIRGPFFDDALALQAHGFKFFWDDWIDHEFKAGLGLLKDTLARLGVTSYHASVGFPVFDSSDTAVHPLVSPANQDAYDPGLHPPKPHVVFPRPFFQEFAVLIPAANRSLPVEALTVRHGPYGVLREMLLRIEHSREGQALPFGDIQRILCGLPPPPPRPLPTRLLGGVRRRVGRLLHG